MSKFLQDAVDFYGYEKVPKNIISALHLYG